MAHEQFNLDRKVSIDNMVDPTGKQWQIHGKRGSALVHARPNPDRADAQIPKEFEGEWTSPQRLKTLIDTWLNRMWDKAEAAQLKAARRSYISEQEMLAEEEPVVKQTAEESLAALDPEIADALGDIIAVKEKDDDSNDEAEPVAEAQVAVPAEEDSGEGTSGGTAHAGRKEEEKEKASKVTKKKAAKKKVAKK